MTSITQQARIWSKNDDLRPIEEIPHPYQQIFEYPCFNVIQTKIFDDVFYTDASLVVAAPTGSGKTTIFELAIVRLLQAYKNSEGSLNEQFKIVYVAPMKALCEERLVDWHRKFAQFGLNAILVTGDSDYVDFSSLLNHNLIITTPEKWDSLTRKWKDNKKLVQLIKLFMIDEVHLLDEESRGSSLETVVCRMKTIEESLEKSPTDDGNRIRFMAVSATLANIEDVAEWLGKFSNVKHFKFSDDFRPVKLNKIVIGYNFDPKTPPFRIDLGLNYKLEALLRQYSNGKPSLIFCSTRKIVEMTAKHLLQKLTISLPAERSAKLAQIASNISNEAARATIAHGIGFHHAGLLLEHRRIIENLFRSGDLPILVTTSTLAMGINLPAHLVIVKSTKCYTNGEFRDYTETAIMQMIGRAGRPQFDTEATALILTTERDKPKFERMVNGLKPIESNLHRHLTEHLNAEVVLRTITDLDVAMKWLSTTFLFIRARKNPSNYGIRGNGPGIDQKLLEMCKAEIGKLVAAGMLFVDEEAVLQPTAIGSLMARYYLAFETMKLFTQLTGNEVLQQILVLISKCQEFDECFLRVNDKKCLNALNKCKNRATIRFPLNGKIRTLDMKINCVIQAVLGCLDICEHSIVSETLKIMRNGGRIAKCLIEYLQEGEDCFRALLSTIILAKCLQSKLWENTPYVSKQLSGIGTVLSNQFVNAGKTTFESIAECNPREIEMLLNKKPPTGNKILDQIKYLPKYSLKVDQETNSDNFRVVINLKNCLDLEKECSVDRNSLMHLIVGDSENRIHLYEKYAHSYMIEFPEVVKVLEIDINGLENVEAHFISENWVGFDCQVLIEFGNNGENKNRPVKSAPVIEKTGNEAYMQTFMDQYVQIKEKQAAKRSKKGNKSQSKPDMEQIIVHSNILLNKIDQIPVKEQVRDDDKSFEVTGSGNSITYSPLVDLSQEMMEEAFDFIENENDDEEHIAPKYSEPSEEVEQNNVQNSLFESNISANCFENIKSPDLINPCSLKTIEPKSNPNCDQIKPPLIFENLNQRNRVENSLNPNPCQIAGETSQNIVSKYKMTPKKFSQNPPLKISESPSGYKAARGNVSRITWKSPVAALKSPSVKFSPNLAQKQNRLNLGFTPKTSIRLPVRAKQSISQHTTQIKPSFPLSDKAYNYPKSDPVPPLKADDIGDFVDESFLECIKAPLSPIIKKRSLLQSPMSCSSSANSYYAQFLRESEKVGFSSSSAQKKQRLEPNNYYSQPSERQASYSNRAIVTGLEKPFFCAPKTSRKPVEPPEFMQPRLMDDKVANNRVQSRSNPAFFNTGDFMQARNAYPNSFVSPYANVAQGSYDSAINQFDNDTFESISHVGEPADAGYEYLRYIMDRGNNSNNLSYENCPQQYGFNENQRLQAQNGNFGNNSRYVPHEEPHFNPSFTQMSAYKTPTSRYTPQNTRSSYEEPHFSQRSIPNTEINYNSRYFPQNMQPTHDDPYFSPRSISQTPNEQNYVMKKYFQAIYPQNNQ